MTSTVTTPLAGKPAARMRGNKALFFRSGGHTCGVPIAKVLRILKYQEVTPLPNATDYVMGMLNLQGRILPVLDLARRLAKRDFNLNDNACIVILQAERDGKPLAFGVAVEEVIGVVDIQTDTIQPPPPGLDGIDLTLVKGITGEARDMRLMLDADGICMPKDSEKIAAASVARN